MDFQKLREYQSECERKITTMCKVKNLDYYKCSTLCRELGYQTAMTKSEAIDYVERALDCGYTYEDIVKTNNLEL